MSALFLNGRQGSNASAHVGASLSATVYYGKTKNPKGVEAAKKLKVDQILLPCQEDFFFNLYGVIISFFSAFPLSESQSILCAVYSIWGNHFAPHDTRSSLEGCMEGDK